MFKFFQHPSERASQFSESSDIIMFYTFGAELVHFRGFIYYRYLWRNVSVFRSKNALFPCYIPVFIFDTVRLFCFGTAGKKIFFRTKTKRRLEGRKQQSSSLQDIQRLSFSMDKYSGFFHCCGVMEIVFFGVKTSCLVKFFGWFL